MAFAAVVKRAFGQVRTGALVWGVVFGGTAAASAVSYVQSFPTPASRHQIAVTTGKDAGLAILFGPISQVGTVGGYTAYKGFVFLTTIGAIWGVLAATRLLRGEEDAGRWQVVLAGTTTARRATVATLLGLAGGVLVLLLTTVALVAAVGRRPSLSFGLQDAAVFGLSVALVPAVFAGVGALASQLARTRRLATGLGLVVFGVAFLVRMVADADPSTRWLLWATPFGWSERVRPLTDNDLLPLLPALATTAVLLGAAVRLAGTRDEGDGVLVSSDVTALRPRGLASPLGLTVRQLRPVLLSWGGGVIATGVVFGLMTKVVSDALPSSLRTTLGRFGAHGGPVDQFLGVGFLFVATLVALVATTVIGRSADDETSGRAVHLLAQPVSTTLLLLGQLLVGAVAAAVAGALSGAAVLVGAASRGITLSWGMALGAGLNVVPTALVVLAVGTVAAAVRPRAGVPVVYAVVVGSLVIDLLSSLSTGLEWTQRLSLFHYMALAPSVRVSARTTSITLAAAVLLGASATWIRARRDLRTG